MTHDGSRAIVSSAWSSEIAIVDVSNPETMKVVSTLKTAREPRAIWIAPDDKTGFVSHLVGADLTRIDDLETAPAASPQTLPAAPSRGPAGVTTSASLGYALVSSPDGRLLFAPRHALGADGDGSWWGAPTVDVLDVAERKSAQPVRVRPSPADSIADVGAGMSPAPEWGAIPGQASSPALTLVQPRAAVYRKKSDTIWIASEGDDAVTEVSAIAPDPAQAIVDSIDLAQSHDLLGGFSLQGGGPSAMALTPDETALLVYCRTTFDLVRVDLGTKKTRWLRLADDGLTEAAARGRRLFADARRSALSGGLGCAACHPEGRDDGYVWREVGPLADDARRFVGVRENIKVNDPSSMGRDVVDKQKLHVFPRQTPMIAGRLRAGGPYGWHGQNKDLLDRLIDGVMLHDETWSYRREVSGDGVTRIDYVVEYARSGLLPPPTLVRDLTADETAGKALFESDRTGCAKCHQTGREMTDRSVVSLPALPVAPGFDNEDNQSWKTPSLWFIGGTAPYFHDGSAATLEDLVAKNGTRMGNTSALSESEQKQLVAYLRTL